MIVGAFARRAVFGYVAIVLSLIATGFLSFGLWVHHMFATAVPELGKSFFTAAEHDDRDTHRRCRSSAGSRHCGPGGSFCGRRCYFVLGFFFIFVIGGLTGIMLAIGAARPAGPRHVSSSSRTCTTC